MESTIEVRNLAKRFGNFEAVKDVSFTVRKGDVFGFLGPNGAGKSTTIRCLLSLIRPNAGSIRLFGKDLQKERSAILSNVGSIIEKPDFYKYMSARKNLEVFARISGADVDASDIQKMLEFVGLGDRGAHKVSGFSHGMKQRLGIAQTLLHDPDLIVLDEPTTGLDPQGIVEVRNLILRLKNEQHKTILLSSHQLSEIELIANRMVIINKGTSIIEGEVAELLNSGELIVVFTLDDARRAADLVQEAFPQTKVKALSDGELEIITSGIEVPRINAYLTQQAFLVHAIEPKRKLEDYFMKIIAQ
ncbi:MAG: ABC transporter ATP-binding protein [Bacteroidetes bacterium]|nr:MAG: ABC transporter ATP-binding protein [Bacteroidota bacterium]